MADDYEEHFGDWLRRMMASRRWSQSELARRMRMSRGGSATG